MPVFFTCHLSGADPGIFMREGGGPNFTQYGETVQTANNFYPTSSMKSHFVSHSIASASSTDLTV